MSPSWLTLFIASVHVLLQAGIVRGKQLEILTWNEANYVSWVCFCPFQGCNWGGFVPHSWDKVEWNSIPPWPGCSGRATIHTVQEGWAPTKRSQGGLADIFKMNWWALFECWPPDTSPCILWCCPHGTFLMERSPRNPEIKWRYQNRIVSR